MTDIWRMTESLIEGLGWDRVLNELEADGPPGLIVDGDGEAIGVLVSPSLQPTTARRMTRTEVKTAGLEHLLAGMAAGEDAILIVHAGAGRPRALLDLPGRADPAVRAVLESGVGGPGEAGRGAAADSSGGGVASVLEATTFRRMTEAEIVAAGLGVLIDEMIAGALPIAIVHEDGQVRAILGTPEQITVRP